MSKMNARLPARSIRLMTKVMKHISFRVLLLSVRMCATKLMTGVVRI